MDMQHEVKLVEKELVDLIIQHLKSNRIAVETARQQAKDFLALLPIQDQRDLLNKLKNLGEKYEEAKEVYAEELGKANEVVRQQTLSQMRSYIQTGNIDAAIAAAKAMYPEKNKNSEHPDEHPMQVIPQVMPQQSAPSVQPEIVGQQKGGSA